MVKKIEDLLFQLLKMFLCIIIIQIKSNEMILPHTNENNYPASEGTILYNCTSDLFIYLKNSNMEILCNRKNSSETIINYDQITSYSLLINGSAFISIFGSNMQQLDKNIANIAKSIYFNTTKYVVFNNTEDISTISSYAKLFNYPDIELWINVSNNCIWQDEKNLTKYWNSKKQNTRWRKTCFSYLGRFSSFLHFSIDDDEIPGKMKIIQKKDFITIIIVVCVVLFVLIVSLYIVGYYCQHRSFDYPSA